MTTPATLPVSGDEGEEEEWQGKLPKDCQGVGSAFQMHAGVLKEGSFIPTERAESFTSCMHQLMQ